MLFRSARIASRLKPYGRVQVNIGVLADKSWHEVPEGGSPWHEYASCVSTPAKFFPHPKIAPHMPAGWVARNRELLLSKAAVLRELGLEAAFAGKETHLLPESFFRKYPHLRGPRVDHPRRSRQEAFAWCTDLPETREMIEWMTAELKRQVPEIQTITTGTNDAGSGLCWAAALYSGPNGPQHCRHRGAGVRVRELMETIHRGASKGGGDVDIRITSANFWQNEDQIVALQLPARTTLGGHDPAAVSVGTLLNDAYPVRGLLNPLAVLAAAERLSDPKTTNVTVSSTAMYARADDAPETVAKLVEILQEAIQHPARGFVPRLDRLRSLAARWGGERHAETVFEAFYRLDEAFRLKHAAAPGYSNFYSGVSMRHLTRPLLIRPGVLTTAEEAYFLPYVFNMHESEAREDYIDLHGSRMSGPPAWSDPGLRGALAAAERAAALFERAAPAPEARWFRQLALGLRLWAGEVRSMHNFYFAQLLRDRRKDVLAGKPRIPEKVPTWTGDPDYLQWNEIQRAELDNTNALIAILEAGGPSLVAHAADARHEDTFLLGPETAAALRRKADLMRAHWLDVQRYLAAPHK